MKTKDISDESHSLKFSNINVNSFKCNI